VSLVGQFQTVEVCRHPPPNDRWRCGIRTLAGALSNALAKLKSALWRILATHNLYQYTAPPGANNGAELVVFEHASRRCALADLD